MEQQRYYRIRIMGVGIRPIYGYSKWHAIDKAYTEFMNVQPDRKEYTILTNKYYKKCTT
jgi:hypothetical protein